MMESAALHCGSLEGVSDDGVCGCLCRWDPVLFMGQSYCSCFGRAIWLLDNGAGAIFSAWASTLVGVGAHVVRLLRSGR